MLEKGPAPNRKEARMRTGRRGSSDAESEIGACGGLGLAAAVTAVRIQHRRTGQQRVQLAEYDGQPTD
jgi:hypothetical protein